MQRFSEHFNIPTSSVEARKIRKQEKCIHLKQEKIYARPSNTERFMLRCVDCQKITGSESLLPGDKVQSNEISL